VAIPGRQCAARPGLSCVAPSFRLRAASPGKKAGFARRSLAAVGMKAAQPVLTLDRTPECRLGPVPRRRPSMHILGIGQLAQQAGVAIDTVRYYERSGLLAPAA